MFNVTFAFGKLPEVIVRAQVLEVAVADDLALDLVLLLNLVEVVGDECGFGGLWLRIFLLIAAAAAVIKLLRLIRLPFGHVQVLDLC